MEPIRPLVLMPNRPAAQLPALGTARGWRWSPDARGYHARHRPAEAGQLQRLAGRRVGCSHEGSRFLARTLDASYHISSRNSPADLAAGRLASRQTYAIELG